MSTLSPVLTRPAATMRLATAPRSAAKAGVTMTAAVSAASAAQITVYEIRDPFRRRFIAPPLAKARSAHAGGTFFAFDSLGLFPPRLYRHLPHGSPAVGARSASAP